MKKPRHRFVDLSIYLENDVLSDPPPLAPRITYQKHADTLPEFMAMIPGTTAEDYPDGEAAAAEWVTLTTHNGTHLDAPWHFHSTQDAKLGGAARQYSAEQKAELAEIDRLYDSKVVQAKFDAEARRRQAAGDAEKLKQIDDDMALEIRSHEARRERRKDDLRKAFDAATGKS